MIRHITRAGYVIPLFVLSVLNIFQGYAQGQYIYGTTSGGGANGTGTIFRTRFDGSQTTTKYNFPPAVNPGANPARTLLLEIAGKVYGTTVDGGMFAAGANI